MQNRSVIRPGTGTSQRYLACEFVSVAQRSSVGWVPSFSSVLFTCESIVTMRGQIVGLPHCYQQRSRFLNVFLVRTELQRCIPSLARAATVAISMLQFGVHVASPKFLAEANYAPAASVLAGTKKKSKLKFRKSTVPTRTKTSSLHTEDHVTISISSRRSSKTTILPEELARRPCSIGQPSLLKECWKATNAFGSTLASLGKTMVSSASLPKIIEQAIIVLVLSSTLVIPVEPHSLPGPQCSALKPLPHFLTTAICQRNIDLHPLIYDLPLSHVINSSNSDLMFQSPARLAAQKVRRI